jgi:hypothetical protein
MRSFLVMTRIVILSMLILFAWIGPSDAGMSRGGFGRFGRLNDDGLLTLNVSPSGFTTVPPMRPLEIRFADEGVRARVSRISATEKVILLLDGGEGSPKSVRYTLLYPGFSAVFGREAVLRISGVRMQVEVSAPDPATGFFWLLLRADEGRCVPLVVAFREGFQPLNWTLKQEGEVGRFEIGGDQELGEVRFITPLGMREFASNSPPKQYELLKTAAAAWAARGIPQLRSRMYRLDPDGQLVSILEAFQSSQGEAIAPLPPVLAFAMGEGYPAEVRGSAVRTDCLTKYGLYVFVEGNRLEYTLPVPPTEERGYIRCQGSPERVQALNSLVGHLAGESATSAADLAYAGVANAQMAWAYLDKERRDQITSAWQEHLSLAFQLPPYIPGQFRDSWREEREPITGAQYYWTSAVSSAPQMDDRSEINLGTALPLYGLYKYGQYSGDWGLVESQWRAAQRIFRYVELADDWAWMTAASGDMGFGTGGGDCMAADYCGRVACLKIARVLGDRSGKEYFAYWAARAAVPTVARFWYTDWARRQGFVPENAVVQGFLEHKTFDASRLDEAGEDPWRNARLLSGNGVFPELFGLYTRDARSALEDFTRQSADLRTGSFGRTNESPVGFR